MCLITVILVLLGLTPCNGHGHLTYPPSRQGGSLVEAGYCTEPGASFACMWFTQPTSIPGEPTVNDERFRTYNVDVSSGTYDWSRTMPWRAPGTAPVSGSGCGIAGGNLVQLPNGGSPPPGIKQGTDGAALPKKEPTVWRRGGVEEVAWAILANHGGGYSYRLCKQGENISEACFQRTVLRFAGDRQWLHYDGAVYQYDKKVKLPRFELPLVKVAEGTFPPGSEWARVPMPGCKLCDQSICGPGLMPRLNETCQSPAKIFHGASVAGGCNWVHQQFCAQSCSGVNLTACPPGMTQFPEPLPGVSGYTNAVPPSGREGFPFSIVDKVIVPTDLADGDYLLSFRWDCEQSHQIWQNCADIRVQGDAMPSIAGGLI